MSTKFYCDICEKELLPEDHGRIKLEMGRVRIEVLRALDKTWNGGHVCHQCTRDVLAGGNVWA